MKRDMELARKILLRIENAEPFETLYDLKIDGYGKQEIAYHCEMLYNEGLIKEYNGFSCDNFDGVLRFYVQDLTWEGQDFLETIREDTIWDKTKSTIKEKGLPMLIGTIKTVATAFVSAAAEGVAKAIVKNGG